MGVTGLWKLIECSGKPVAVETLENKVIAVDISIWLHQVVKGYQDNKGGHIQNAHIIGLFNRICKLLYFRIKPVFIFDGKICDLKYDTISKRAQQKSKIKDEANRIEQLLLESLAKESVLKEVLGSEVNTEELSPVKKKHTTKTNDDKDDIYKLPDNAQIKLDIKTEAYDEQFACPKKSYSKNISKIDVNSSFFKSLPADKRHEILMDIKDTRKQSSWGKLQELPVESNDFSSYQMAGLLKRRQVQVSLEDAEKKMGGKNWSLSELEALLKEDGVIESNFNHAQKIISDENTRFLLVRDIAKAINDAKIDEENRKNEPKPSTSKQVESNEDLLGDDEYDIELQKAIQMSLGNDVDEEEEKVENKNEAIKLNKDQRKKFGETVPKHDLVRGFMMEYAGMNDDDIQEMVNGTQIEEEVDKFDDTLSQKFPHTDRYVLYGTPEKKKEIPMEKENDRSELTKISSQNDAISVNSSQDSLTEKKEFVITVDTKLSSYSKDNDLFSDIFEQKKSKIIEIEEDDDDETPDVEIASIASSDDTVDYELPEQFSDKLDDESKEIESGFVSEEGKLSNDQQVVSNEQESEEDKEVLINENENDAKYLSESDKFWSSLDDIREVSKSNEIQETLVKIQDVVIEKKSEIIEKIPEKRQNAEESSEIMQVVDETANDFQIQDLPDIIKDTQVKSIQEKSENEKFWSFDDEEEIKSRSIQITPQKSAEKVDIIDSDEELEILKLIEEKLQSPEKCMEVIEREEAFKSFKAKVKENTTEELEQMQNELKQQQKDFAHERNRLNRMAVSITQAMSDDCKDLLKLFGIPYINSPMEAEAQCAFLNQIEMVDGVITDDSDVWLFGAKTVYKNFFVQKKNVMEFQMQNIEEMFHLDRNKLIQLAMLVGSDYTLGITGVGSVTALEILAAFPGTESDEYTDHYQSLLSSLRKFRDWFKNGKEVGTSAANSLKSKLKNIDIAEDFPSQNVMKAYLEPKVNSSTEPFSWESPDVESLIELTKTKLGWTRLKTEEILKPVMNRLNEKKQSTIKDYFKSQMTKKVLDNQKMSKRVQKAVGRMGGKEDEEPKPKEKQPRKRKVTAKIKKEEKKEVEEIEKMVLNLSDEDDDEPVAKKSSPEINAFSVLKQTPTNSPAKISPLKKSPVKRKRKAKASNEPQPSTSKQADDAELLPPKKAPRIPETKQIIPQRERDKEEQEMNKKKAVEIFKRTRKPK